jgi:hypothetical protein
MFINLQRDKEREEGRELKERGRERCAERERDVEWEGERVFFFEGQGQREEKGEMDEGREGERGEVGQEIVTSKTAKIQKFMLLLVF